MKKMAPKPKFELTEENLKTLEAIKKVQENFFKSQNQRTLVFAPQHQKVQYKHRDSHSNIEIEKGSKSINNNT